MIYSILIQNLKYPKNFLKTIETGLQHAHTRTHIYTHIVFLTPVTQQAFTHYRRYPPARLKPVTLFLRYLESTTLSLDERTLSIFGARPLEERDPLVKRSLCILLATSPRRVKPLKSRATLVAPHHCTFFHSMILRIKISFEI